MRGLSSIDTIVCSPMHAKLVLVGVQHEKQTSAAVLNSDEPSSVFKNEFLMRSTVFSEYLHEAF